jgi:hypothetical protein
VLPAERAAAVVGDFAEEAEERGKLWFWNSVIRTAVSRLASDFTERPLVVLRAGTLGYLRSLAVFVLWTLLVRAVIVPMMFAYPATTAFPAWLPLTKWPFEILWTVWLFFCGQWAGRRAPGSELASGITIVLIGWIPIIAWLAAIRNLPALAGLAISLSPHDMAAVAGALWARRQVVKLQAA